MPLIDDKPLLYRTHYELYELMQIPSACNKLIFLTRNPKELLFRAYHLISNENQEPDFDFIENFLHEYLKPFEVYEAWDEKNRILIYYEDVIANRDQILLDILDFMEVKPTYFEDFIKNQEKYQERLLSSYKQQHQKNRGGESVTGGAKAIFYSQNVKLETLRLIDEYLAKIEPKLWEKYLKRFETLLCKADD